MCADRIGERACDRARRVLPLIPSPSGARRAVEREPLVAQAGDERRGEHGRGGLRAASRRPAGELRHERHEPDRAERREQRARDEDEVPRGSRHVSAIQPAASSAKSSASPSEMFPSGKKVVVSANASPARGAAAPSAPAMAASPSGQPAG